MPLRRSRKPDGPNFQLYHRFHWGDLVTFNVLDGRQYHNWDGYVAERQVLLDWMVEKRTPNPIVITGDSHNNWVRNVPPDITNFDAPPVATEFMGTSISTNGDPGTGRFVRIGDAQNPHPRGRAAGRRLAGARRARTRRAGAPSSGRDRRRGRPAAPSPPGGRGR
jgi:phosphodiesterase/alkaline phosphatase D-like protein